MLQLGNEGIVISGAPVEGGEEILTPEALRFVADLHRCFESKRRDLLARRQAVQAMMDAGGRPGFLAETRAIREGTWSAAALPEDLRGQRIECVGSVTGADLVAGLNSSANAYVADFAHATSPTWHNLIQGQLHLAHAIRRTLVCPAPGPDGGQIELEPVVATLIVQPRGWHLVEDRLAVDGAPVSASLMDAGLFLFHNAERLRDGGSGPYFSLVGLQSHHEARLWNEVFLYAQHLLGVPVGTLRATISVDTIMGAFESEEIVHELREHAAGLVADRWNYLASLIGRFHRRSDFRLPDADLITMERHFLCAAAELVVDVAHRRGVPAIGDVSRQMPIPTDPIAHRVAMARVMADKTREAETSFDGTRVAHPGLVQLARGAFDAQRRGRDGGGRGRGPHSPESGRRPRARDLQEIPAGSVTDEGMRTHVRVCLRYLESWLRGAGHVPVRHDLIDLAVVEAARSQLWHWVSRGIELDDGRRVSAELYGAAADYEMGSIRRALGEEEWALGEFERARALLDELVTGPQPVSYLTDRGMPALLEREISLG